MWNLEQLQLKEPGSHEQLESEIQVPLKKESGIQNAESSTWNPESTAWNPESKALFDSIISGDISKKKENQRSKICLETEGDLIPILTSRVAICWYKI